MMVGRNNSGNTIMSGIFGSHRSTSPSPNSQSVVINPKHTIAMHCSYNPMVLSIGCLTLSPSNLVKKTLDAGLWLE